MPALSLLILETFSQALLALCQLQYVGDKITSGEVNYCLLHFYIQIYENPFFEIFKVPKTKVIPFDMLDQIIYSFKFRVGIWFRFSSMSPKFCQTF